MKCFGKWAHPECCMYECEYQELCESLGCDPATVGELKTEKAWTLWRAHEKMKDAVAITEETE